MQLSNLLIGLLSLFAVEGINVSVSELASRDASLEENVEFGSRAASGLGKTEEGPHKLEETESSPDETTLSSEIPR